MYRITIFLISLILSLSVNSLAAKLGMAPSPLIMEGGIGMQIDVENVQKNVPFNTFVDWIGAKSEDFRGSLALALISEDGEIKELIHEEKGVSLSPGWGFGQWQRFLNLTVTADISDTDIIRFITLSDGDATWLPVTSSSCKSTFCKVKGNEVVKAKITVNVLGRNEIPYEGYCDGTKGESRQSEPIYTSSYTLKIEWPAGKDHRFIKVGPNLDRIQIDPDGIFFQIIDKPEYTVTIMACSDDELITEQRHFNVGTPGSLGQLLRDDKNLLYINNISVSGHIDENDIVFMRDEMPMLEHIDLSDAKISGDMLPDGAFEEKGIKSLILPKNLKGLGANSLRATKLFQLDIPEGVRYYGLNALNYSEDLTVIVLHNPKVIPVSWCVLEGTNRGSGVLLVPKGTREAFVADSQWGQFGLIVEGDNADDYVSEDDGTYTYSGIYPNVTVSNVIKPDKVMIVPETVELKGRAFNVIGIGSRVFSSDMINEIYIPKSVVSLGEYTIQSSCYNLVKIEVDENNLSFFSDGGVLYDRKTSTMLTYPRAKRDSYIVPEGIRTIGGWACYNDYLHKITFPSTLQSIGLCAFCYSSLKYANPIIISKAEVPPVIGYDGFDDKTYLNAKVYVPAKSLDTYKSDVGWGKFTNIYAISEDSGIEEMEADEECVTIIGNAVTIDSNNPVEIYGVDGRLFYKGKGDSISLPDGIYLIRINGKVKKVRI